MTHRLKDHRLEYLDYEGHISGNRGQVYRIDRGRYREFHIQTRLIPAAFNINWTAGEYQPCWLVISHSFCCHLDRMSSWMWLNGSCTINLADASTLTFISLSN